MEAQTKLVNLAKAIQSSLNDVYTSPEDGHPARTQEVFPLSIVNNTKGYIKKVANQVNGTYERGWYDACAVMIRRLIETLIIEAFEKHGIAAKIQGSSGDFFYLRDMVTATLVESSWNLGCNVKTALPRLKDIGDKSAHSRRFNAHKRDIDAIKDDLRVVIQELVYLAE
jgi:hypothetical protein